MPTRVVVNVSSILTDDLEGSQQDLLRPRVRCCRTTIRGYGSGEIEDQESGYAGQEGETQLLPEEDLGARGNRIVRGVSPGRQR